MLLNTQALLFLLKTKYCCRYQPLPVRAVRVGPILLDQRNIICIASPLVHQHVHMGQVDVVCVVEVAIPIQIVKFLICKTKKQTKLSKH